MRVHQGRKLIADLHIAGSIEDSMLGDIGYHSWRVLGEESHRLTKGRCGSIEYVVKVFDTTIEVTRTISLAHVAPATTLHL